jgi:hypothetical protein
MQTSCSDDNELSQNDFFIFGTTYGFCFGNCTHLYKYENDQVFADEMDRFELENLVFSNENQPEIVSIAEELLDQFPSELLNSTEERYGCPDCHDQGTIFLQRKIGQDVQSWYLDTEVQEEWSKKLRDYHKLLTDRMSKIIN